MARTNDDPMRDMVAGRFYHHLILGIRISFERAYNLPDGYKYVVVCRNQIVCYAHTDHVADAKRAFKIIEENHANAKASTDASGNENEWVDREERNINGEQGDGARQTSRRGIRGC